MAWDPNDRTLLEDLKFKHRDAIGTLRAQLDGDVESGGRPTWADDVWLLRYALAFEGDVPSGFAAAKKAIEWRRDNAALVDAAIQRQPPPDFTEKDLNAIELFLAASFYSCSVHGDPLFVSRLVGYNLRALMDQLGEEKLEKWLDHTNECAWQYCEAASRARGIFVKQINFTDVASASMKPEMRFVRALGASSKTNEWLRPQLVGKSYIFNPPMWLRWARGIAEKVMSAKAMERTVVHNGAVGAGKPLCPFAKRVLGEAGPLPRFLGGTNSALDQTIEENLFPSSQRPASALDGSSARGDVPRELAVLARLPQIPLFESAPAQVVAAADNGEISSTQNQLDSGKSTSTTSSSFSKPYPPTKVVENASPSEAETTATSGNFWSGAMCQRRRKDSVPQVSEIETSTDGNGAFTSAVPGPSSFVSDQATVPAATPIEAGLDTSVTGDTNRCCARWCCRRARYRQRGESQEQYGQNLLAT